MSELLTEVKLLDSELLLLDGKCSGDVQAAINSVKERRALADSLSALTPAEVKLIHSVLNVARSSGQLKPQWVKLRLCEVCGKKAGYATVKRSSRHKTKGEPDYDKPLSMRGVDFAQGVIVIKGYAAVGCCAECYEKVKGALLERLQSVPCELSGFFGVPSRWKRYDNRECTKCGWKGHKGQMLPRPALMGGFYPGGCPNCEAENVMFGPMKIKIADGFELVEVKQASETPGSAARRG
jgi:hypothetical protein